MVGRLLTKCLIYCCLYANVAAHWRVVEPNTTELHLPVTLDVEAYKAMGSFLGNVSTFRSTWKRVSRSSKFSTGLFESTHTLELQNVLKSERVPTTGEGLSAIAVHLAHDSSIAISKNGRVQCVLELERLFWVRYFAPYKSTSDGNGLRYKLRAALRAVRTRCVCEEHSCPLHFDYGLISVVKKKGVLLGAEIAHLVETFFSVKEWRYYDHHHAHALLGFYDSPFDSALVVSYDGGGNDGIFNAYAATRQATVRVAKIDLDLGNRYNALASLMPEVTGLAREHAHFCSLLDVSNDTLQIDAGVFMEVMDHYDKSLSVAGKLMGYAATGGSPQKAELRALVRRYFRAVGDKLKWVPVGVVKAACGPVEQQRVLAALVQDEFASVVVDVVKSLLQSVQSTGLDFDGVVFTGGCALNVIANQLVHDELTKSAPSTTSRKKLGFHVPPAPNDSGLSAGALWLVSPPSSPHPLQYLGFPLWDVAILDEKASEWNAERLSSLGGVAYLAELLSGGPAWIAQGNRTETPIIAVVRGRQEFGPRALGHRSLLAVPCGADMKDRLNRLKFREWYRPVAPMIADEDLDVVFGRTVKSPYMSMAPLVRDEVRLRYPALAHLDGTARHQSVGQGDEPWLHSLLLAVKKWIGLAALINTSFNSKGRPITNSVAECLRMLEELPDLDYVLIEDWLFRAPARQRSKPNVV